MLYQEMAPFQIRKAIEENVPVVLSIGTLEYHSEHLPLGVDTMVVDGCLKRVEKRHPEMILLPTFYYGVSSFAVKGPENGNGTVSIDSMNVCKLAEDLFSNLLETGFRNIHGFVYHQGENFFQGMPTDLAFRVAGRRAIFAFLERTRGRGWWGNAEMKNYYEDNNVFDWIRIHPVAAGVSEKYPGGHADIVETSAIMDLHPHLVHMDHHNPADWYAESALKATAQYGKNYMDDMAGSVEKLLFG